MNTLDKLILMVPILTKSEKRAFTLYNKDSNFYILYQIIGDNPTSTNSEIEALFEKKQPGSNINVTAIYLYEKLLDTLCRLEESKNLSMQLTNKIFASRILMKKSLYSGAIDLIEEVKQISKRNRMNEIFLLASQAELDLLLKLDFVGISEKELSDRHFEVNNTINAIRKSEGVASLYDLMKYRTYHYDIMRSEEQKNSLNDLLMSELSINSSQGEMSFEALKFHQLFQATYLMGVHDYRSALRALKELINLFKENPHTWENNQYYFIEAVEGALQSLRFSKQYESMPYFITQLDEVKANSKAIQSYLNLLKIQYAIIPKLDKGDFKGAWNLLSSNLKGINKDLLNVNLDKQAELYLYGAIILFGIGNYTRVKEILTPLIFQSKIYSILPIIRTIRLLHLMAIYELDLIEDYDFEIKSFKRKLASEKNGYKVESLILKFILRPKRFFSKNSYEWEKWRSDIYEIREDVYELQLLNLFDFTMWIESKFTHSTLSDLLKEDDKL